MKNWSDLSAFFSALRDEEYVVLRNYETLVSAPSGDRHPDIDVLCRDRDCFLAVSGSVSRTKNAGDALHRKILIGGSEVPLDVRCIGDGYYDAKWEEEILASRFLWNDLCFVPDEREHFYSLLYHALIQKRKLSDEYKRKLEIMAKQIGVRDDDPVSVRVLEAFMRDRGYFYTFPENPGTVFNIRGVDPSLVEKNAKRRNERILFRIRRRLGLG